MLLGEAVGGRLDQDGQGGCGYAIVMAVVSEVETVSLAENKMGRTFVDQRRKNCQICKQMPLTPSGYPQHDARASATETAMM